MSFKIAILSFILLSFTGCQFAALGRPTLTSHDPALKIPAMKRAARHHDFAALPLLIKALSSQDSAIRFYAIYALHKITEHEFGYVYYAPQHQRSRAITRWKKWLAATGHQPHPDTGVQRETTYIETTGCGMIFRRKPVRKVSFGTVENLGDGRVLAGIPFENGVKKLGNRSRAKKRQKSKK